MKRRRQKCRHNSPVSVVFFILQVWVLLFFDLLGRVISGLRVRAVFWGCRVQTPRAGSGGLPGLPSIKAALWVSRQPEALWECCNRPGHSAVFFFVLPYGIGKTMHGDLWRCP